MGMEGGGGWVCFEPKLTHLLKESLEVLRLSSFFPWNRPWSTCRTITPSSNSATPKSKSRIVSAEAKKTTAGHVTRFSFSFVTSLSNLFFLL